MISAESESFLDTYFFLLCLVYMFCAETLYPAHKRSIGRPQILQCTFKALHGEKMFH